MKSIAALSVVGLLLVGTSAAAGDGALPVPNMVADTCSVCHGNDGISTNSSFPNLAAQTKTYLGNQLKNFRDRSRADPYAKAYMWSVAGPLSDKMIDQIADYFSSLKAAKGAAGGDPASIAAGKTTFLQGIASKNVPACAACHGANAAGSDMFPRLAGQHRDYLVAQLQAFRSNARDNATMHLVTEHMSDQQIRDVAAYLASL
jgi:cytochrome c553